MRKHATAFIAAALLLLPVLYLGSYLALVVPQGQVVSVSFRSAGTQLRVWKQTNYRLGSKWLPSVFWPLEQIDRRARPERWGSEYDQRIPRRSRYVELFDPNCPRQSVVP